MTMKVGGVEFDITVDASGVAVATTKSVKDLELLQKKLKDTDPAAKKASDSLGNMGRKAGAAGIQIQQLVGQIQGGQNVFGALSAQAADLGIVLGAPLIGAVAGLGAAFAGVLLPSLFNTEDKTQDLIDKLRELSETKILSKEQAALLAQEERKLIKEKEGLRDAASAEIKEQQRLIQVMRDSMARNSDSQIAYENYSKSIKEANEEIVVQQANLKTLNDELGESGVKLDYYNSMMKGSAEQTKAQTEEINNLVDAIESQAGAIGKTDRQLAIKMATEKGANEQQLASINAAYDLIEAEEKRAEAIVQSAIKEREAVKQRIEAQRNYESLLDEIFNNQKKREEEQAQKKEQVGLNLDKLREDLMTEEELRAQYLATRLEQLQEAQELELVSQAEFDELKKGQVNSYLEWLVARESQAADERKAIEADAQQAMNALRRSAINNAIGFLDQFAGESKLAAIASIALTKGLAIAQTLAHAQTASMLAYSSQLIPGDPTSVARAEAARNYTLGIGKLSAGLIAATGLAQAAAAGGGSRGGAYSGGVPATTTTTNGSDTGGTVIRRSIDLNFTGNAPPNARELVEILNEAVGDGVKFNYGGG